MSYTNEKETITYKGCMVMNVPYKLHNYPCECGCGEPMKSQSTGTIIRVKFLVNIYMPDKGLKVFNYNNFQDVEEQFKQWWYHDRKEGK